MVNGETKKEWCPLKTIIIYLAMFCAIIAVATTLHAQTSDWNGGSTSDSNWSNPDNWSGAGVPSNTQVIMQTQVRQENNNDLSAGTEIPSLTFSNTGFICSGNLLGITDGIYNDNGQNTIAMPIRFIDYLGGGSISTTLGTTLNINGTIDTNVNTITLDNVGMLNVGGRITGSGSLDLTGTGTTTFSSIANDYDGMTTISAGTLKNGANNVIPDSSSVLIASGACYDLNGYNEKILRLYAGGDVNVGSGTLEIGGDRGPNEIDGNISGSGKLVLSGGGVGISVNYATAENTFTGTFETKNNARLVLTGENGALASAREIVLTGGTFGLIADNSDNINPDRLNDSGTVTLKNGWLGLSGGSAPVTETVGAIHVDEGAGYISVNSWGSPTTLHANEFERSLGTVMEVSSNNGDLGGNEKITFGTGAPTPVHGIIPYTRTWNLTANDYVFATYDPDKGMIPTALTDYVDTFAGAGHESNVRITTSKTLTSSAEVNSVILADTSLLGDSGHPNVTLTVGSGGIMVTGETASPVISVPVIQFGEAEGIIQKNCFNTLVISSKISGSNGVTFAYSWPQESVIRLDNTANDYDGMTTISAGTLKNGANNVIPDSSSVLIASGACYDLNGYNEKILRLYAGGDVNVGSGTLEIGGDRGPNEIDGNISGSGKLVLSGGGVGISVNYATAENTFTGTFETKNNARLVLTGENGALASAREIVLTGGTFGLIADNSDNINPDRLNDSGTVTLKNGWLGLSGGSAPVTETVGAIHVDEGAGYISVNSWGSPTTLHANEFERSLGTVMEVSSNNGDLGGNEKITFGTGAPTPVHGIIPYTRTWNLTANDYVFATYDPDKGMIPTALTDYVDTFAGAGHESNVRITTSKTLTSSAEVNSVILADTSLLGDSGHPNVTLTVGSGGIMVTGETASPVISVPVIQFGEAEGIIQKNCFNTLVISSKISGSNGVTFAYSWPQESVIRLDNTANDYTGGTFICGGTLIYGATNVLPVNGGVTITGNGVLSLGNYNATVGSISVLDGSMMSTGGVLTAGAYTLTRGTLDVPISGAGTLTKASDGTLTITNNVSLFSGSVVVQEGKLIVNTDMTSSNVTVQSGGILGGTGAVVNVTVEDGGTWSPGNSPGTQIAASALWEGGGTYLWEINDATESKKGVNPGYDWLDITGELEITASAENQFNIDITSLLPSTNNPGDADNFNSLNDYMWTIASVGGGITWSGDRDIFKLIDNFTNAGATLNKFFINFEGSNLKMAYSASGTDPWGAGDVPEPSTLLLLLPLLGKIAFRIIKTKRKDQ